MRTLRVKLLAYRQAESSVYEEGKRKFLQLIEEERVEFVDTEPDVLFFLSGGSERQAVDLLHSDKFVLLLAFEAGNSYAAATEVKAYANQHGIRTLLLSIENPGPVSQFIRNFAQVQQGFSQLRGQRLGLIGEVSEWLIASVIDDTLLREKLGIDVIRIPWDTMKDFRTFDTAPSLPEHFQTASYDLQETGQVLSLLQHCIQHERLNAMTVECFSLVTAHAVTACLPLAQLNTEGFPAGCEGDLVSIAGMMLAKEITGVIPWMANTVSVTRQQALFAHCTVAPNLLRDYTITTHFETGKGTAVQGTFAAEFVTIFRVNSALNRAFLSPGKILRRPRYETACRTQIEVELPETAIQSLREAPLGNHHLILPGDHTETLSLASHVLGLTLQ